MEHLLQKVSGARVISFLDGFLGYNQIVLHPEDQEKTAFTTPWGTFMYSNMPFGMMNVGATFQRTMDIAFVGEKDKFVLIYLDGITVFCSTHKDHLKHLKKVFLKCRQFGISVNPKKSQFALEEGKLLGHIVSAEGEINPHSSGQHKWILVATDYFTKWIEAIPTKNANHQVFIKFLNENIFTRFGCPTKLDTNNAATFKVEELVDMCESMGIQSVHSTSYYPQGNGLAESSNKSLLRITKKLLEDNKKS
eukprot:PITA_33959